MSLDELGERFWSKVDRTGSCWVWTAARSPKGYGMIRIAGKTHYAHRLAADVGIGPLTDSTVDHRCHNRACVRPDHLRLVSPKQNSENLAGAHRDNPSGVRGVSWDARTRKWQARASSAGRTISKRFASKDDAANWVRQQRNALFTHNDLDR